MRVCTDGHSRLQSLTAVTLIIAAVIENISDYTLGSFIQYYSVSDSFAVPIKCTDDEASMIMVQIQLELAIIRRQLDSARSSLSTISCPESVKLQADGVACVSDVIQFQECLELHRKIFLL